MMIKVKHCCSTVVCAKVTRHLGHITVANVDGNYVWISLHVSNIFICEMKWTFSLPGSRNQSSSLFYTLFLLLFSINLLFN